VRPLNAWVLNFDADDELARPAGYTPSRAVAARAPALVERVAPLVCPGDVVIEPRPGGAFDPASRAPTALIGRAWCPTPRALAVLRRAGVAPAPAPPLDVLRRANHRRFCAELGQPLPGARYVAALDELEAVIAGPSPAGHWLLKRPFGFAGRGRLRVAEGALEASARRWVLASLAPRALNVGDVGLQVEPWVERRGDFSLHGHVSRNGAIRLGEPCVQRCDARGAYLDAARAAAGDLDERERRDLEAAAAEAGRALADAGYFGPFGVDAFRWADERGRLLFNPRGEINARYTMAWATGMGGARPDLEEASTVGYAAP
jgi:hypothetical protein